MSTCSGAGCGAEIEWTVTELGKRMPLDPGVHTDGNVVLRRTKDGSIRAHVLTGDELPALAPVRRAHWQTCPASPQYRKRVAATTPKCRACGHPMDPTLARRERWTTHPGCDATENRAHAEASLQTSPGPVQRGEALPGFGDLLDQGNP